MITIKSIEHAKKIVGQDVQLNMQMLINRRLYTKQKNWFSVKLSENCLLEVANHVSTILGGRSTTKTKVFNSVYYGRPQHWGLERIIVSRRKDDKDKRRKKIYISYCAGQDHTWELNTIRNDIK